MRKFLKTLIVGASLLFGGCFTSCDNSLTYEPNPNDSIQVQLVKTPDVVAYSGEQVLGSTFGTRTVNLPAMYATRSSEPTFTKWQSDTKIQGWPETTDRGEQVSSAEKDYVIKYLADHPNEGSLECDIMPYFLQNVGGSGVTYNLNFMNGDQVHHSTNITGSNQMDYLVIGGSHINDYNATYGNRIFVENLPLTNPTYKDSYANLIIENHYRFYTIPNENGNGYSLYLCFDYSTSKYDNGDLEDPADGVYNDWVIKIIPGVGQSITPPNNEDNCDKCPHEKHEGKNCEQCEEGKACNPKKEEPSETPDDSLMGKFKNDHVEINLSIEERDNVEWLASHLSIHVRAVTDVEVFIPLPIEYYCQVDDMAIVQKHREDLMIHEGPKTSTYTINGDVVSMTVSFESEGIRVTTNGINENVISYLNETYGDGLTFEVWNYMNLRVRDWNDITNRNGNGMLGYDQENEITVGELREYLNQSKVWFTNNPSLYVNAFMYDSECTDEGEHGLKGHGCERFIDDCTVTPQDYPQEHYPDYWYNGSPFNELYVNSNVEE